jgi:hypothetical protein
MPTGPTRGSQVTSVITVNNCTTANHYWRRDTSRFQCPDHFSHSSIAAGRCGADQNCHKTISFQRRLDEGFRRSIRS